MLVKVGFIPQAIESIYEHQDWAYGVLIDRGLTPSQRPRIANVRGEVHQGGISRRVAKHLPEILFQSPDAHAQLPQEALLEFVNIKTGNKAEALNCLLKYGILDEDNLQAQDYHPEEIKAYWRDSAEKGFITFVIPLIKFWDLHSRISDILNLSRALANKDQSAAEAPCRRLLNPTWDEPGFKRDWLLYAKFVIRRCLTPGLEKVRVGITEDKGKLIAATVPYGLGNALYLLLVEFVTKDTPLAECENQRCKKLFIVTRPGRKFCSSRCQGLIKVHLFRFREEEKRRAREELAKQGKKTAKKGKK